MRVRRRERPGSPPEQVWCNEQEHFRFLMLLLLKLEGRGMTVRITSVSTFRMSALF